MRTPLLAAALFATLAPSAGCDASKPVQESEVRVAAVARLALGETATVDGVRVTFERVEEDSRCPDTAMCVWAGVALVDLALDGEPYRLRVADPQHEPEAGVRIGGHLVFAVGLSGGPSSDEDPVVTVATARAE